MGILESYNRVAGEVQSQAELISQIRAALAEKAAGGGMELPDIAEADLGAASDLAANKQLIDADGNIVTGALIEVPAGGAVFGLYDHEMGGTKGDTKFNAAATWKNDALKDGLIIRYGARLGFRGFPTALLGDAELSDVAKGKTFTSAAGYLVEGTMEAAAGGGLAVKKGNTSSPTIETGLSSIDYFVLMADTFSVAGLVQLLYRKPNNAVSYILCTSYTYNSTKTELNHASMASSTLLTIDGGKVTWNGTGTSAFMSGASYMWLAFGTE